MSARSARPRPWLAAALLAAAWVTAFAAAWAALPAAAQPQAERAPVARSAGPAAPVAPAARLNLLQPPAGTAAAAPEGTRQILGLLQGRSRPVPVGALLGSDEKPVAPEGAYAVVLADRGPRSVALCQAMTQGLAFVDPARLAGRELTPRPIYWLLARTGAQVAATTEVTCEQLVADLDLLRAGAAALDGHEGPKLRAVFQRGSEVVDVLWDLSGQPASEFRRAVGLWADLLADDPERWEGRVRQMRLIEDFRGFLIHVGAPLQNLLGVQAATASAPPHVIQVRR